MFFISSNLYTTFCNLSDNLFLSSSRSCWVLSGAVETKEEEEEEDEEDVALFVLLFLFLLLVSFWSLLPFLSFLSLS